VGALDRSAVEWMSSLHWPVVTPVIKGLTLAGAAGLVWIVLAAVVAVRLRRPLVLIAMIVAIEAASSADRALKSAIGRTRPFVGDPHVHPSIGLPHDPSMPSGHAMNAFTGAVLLALVVPRARWPLLGLAALIALSRVYLGVHFPSDAIAGAILGTAVGAAAAWLLARGEGRLRGGRGPGPVTGPGPGGDEA
jgi:undecaprenyl-diphosphatase